MRLAFLIPPMMLLAACGSEEKKAGEGTEISINAEGDGGGIKIQTGKDGGKIRIGGDGAAGEVKPSFTVALSAPFLSSASTSTLVT